MENLIFIIPENISRIDMKMSVLLYTIGTSYFFRYFPISIRRGTQF